MDRATFEIGPNWTKKPLRVMRDIERKFDAKAKALLIHQRYEEAVAAGDWLGLASLFAEAATFFPMTGGMVQGSKNIQSFYKQSGQIALEVQSSRTETIREDLILDIGTFTVTIATEAGSMDVPPGEYVILAEDAGGGFRIRSLTTFPMRQAPLSHALSRTGSQFVSHPTNSVDKRCSR